MIPQVYNSYGHPRGECNGRDALAIRLDERPVNLVCGTAETRADLIWRAGARAAARCHTLPISALIAAIGPAH